MWILLSSALLKATFSSYSAKSFSKALSREHDSTEKEIKGLNDWAKPFLGKVKEKKFKNNMGSNRNATLPLACFTVFIFKLQNLISNRIIIGR